MKSNLTLIQPNEYNNLFSSYHNEVKTNKNKNYNLPKITKLFTTPNSKQNKAYNNLKLKINSKKFNKMINENKRFLYPILNISMNNKTMTKASTNLESFTNSIDKLDNTNNYNLIRKINNERKNNLHQLKMVYLNLFNIKSRANNNSLLNFDSFFNSIDNFELMDNEERERISQKLYEINNKSIIKIKNIFNETNFNKLNNDFRSINDIQKSQLNKFAEKLINKYKDNYNINRDENSSFNSFNKSQERNYLVTNNIFFDWILDNVKHKIELKNEYNQHLTSVWVQNLINDEINQLKNKFVDFRKSLNLSNYLEREKANKSFNKGIYIKKDDSYFTSSTYRTNLNQSRRKSSINNNNSNIISNYNSSYDQDDLHKLINNKNYTINEMNMGFDFFTNKNRNRTLLADNQKNLLDFLFRKDIKFNSINNNSKNNLNKIHLKNNLIITKNKTELENEYSGQNSDLFKKLYVNNPRNNKIKNFKVTLPNDIKSNLPLINNEFNKRTSASKNIDIIEKINNKTINDSSDSDSSEDPNDSFYSIKRAKNMSKYRNSLHNSPSKLSIINNFENEISNDTINHSQRNSSKKNMNYKRYSEAWRKPTFKDLKYKNVVNSLFKHGKYVPKYEENSSDDDTSSDFSDSDSESDENDSNAKGEYKSKKKKQSKKKKIKLLKKKNNKNKSKKKSKNKSKDRNNNK